MNTTISKLLGLATCIALASCASESNYNTAAEDYDPDPAPSAAGRTALAASQENSVPKGRSAFASALGSVLEVAVGAVGVVAQSQLNSGSSTGAPSYNTNTAAMQQPSSNGSTSAHNSGALSQANRQPLGMQGRGNSNQETTTPSQPKTLGMVTPHIDEDGMIYLHNTANESVRVDYTIIMKDTGKHYDNIGKIGIRAKGIHHTLFKGSDATVVVLRVY
jgi:hypothetical protein